MTQKKEVQLADEDVRAIVRLISSTSALEGNLAQRRRHFMAGLCRLLKIDAWAWGQAASMEPGQLPVYVGLMHGGFSDQQFARFLNVQTHTDMAWLTAPISRELKDTKRHVTQSMQRVLPIPEFLATEVSAFWRESGVYPTIVSFYPQADGIISAVGMYRRCGAPWATEREVRIAHILLSELAWLHVHQSPEALLADVPRLSARQRLLLELLLQGQSRKFIAGQMGISINTVAGYVRDIYRYFGVTSQSQLVRRFFQAMAGTGADLPCVAGSDSALVNSAQQPPKPGIGNFPSFVNTIFLERRSVDTQETTEWDAAKREMNSAGIRLYADGHPECAR